jgi:hypothetical protein
MPICEYSRRCQPEMMFTPNRPGAMLSMVTAMRAAIGGGIVKTAQVANSLIRVVTAASPAISVKDSRLWSQYCDGPPKPCSLIIESAKSNPNRSAFSMTVRFKSKVGMYCGEVVDISQPLLPIGRKTPSCMGIALQMTKRWRCCHAPGGAHRQDEMNSFHLRVR